MDSIDLRSQVISLLDIALKHAGAENRSLIISRVQKMAFDADSAKRSIRRIRTVISLLISEDLAADIYEELTALVKADSKEGSPPYR